MRFLTAAILILVLSLAATWVFPWWTLAIVAFTVSLLLCPHRAFLAGFVAIFTLWLGVGLLRDFPNGHVLSSRMAGVFSLPHWSLYLIVAAVIGGLVGGFAAWAGAAVRPTATKNGSPHLEQRPVRSGNRRA